MRLQDMAHLSGSVTLYTGVY